jgi:hypothetical protein
MERLLVGMALATWVVLCIGSKWLEKSSLNHPAANDTRALMKASSACSRSAWNGYFIVLLVISVSSHIGCSWNGKQKTGKPRSVLTMLLPLFGLPEDDAYF